MGWGRVSYIAWVAENALPNKKHVIEDFHVVSFVDGGG